MITGRKNDAKGKNLPENILLMLQEAEDLKFSGRHEEAIKVAEKILFDDPANIPALEEISDNFLSLNKFKEARKAAMQAIKLDKKSYTGFYILGFIESHLQNWQKSIEHLNEANQIYPNNAEILRCLGWSLYNYGEKITGIVTLERTLNLDPHNILTLCDLGVCYLDSKNFDKALSLFYQVLEIDPNNQRAKECIQFAHDLQNHSKNNQKKWLQKQ